MAIKDNIDSLKVEIGEICNRINRDPRDITIIAIAKTFTHSQILEAFESGIMDIGENRVQEAQQKYEILKDSEIRWHLVGHLQRNKVKKALEIFDLIHSVDSIRLAEEIDRRARSIGKRQKVLIEVNISEEASKYGLSLTDVIPFLEQIHGFTNIAVMGLMAIAPYYEDSERSRPVFQRLRELKEEIEDKGFDHVKMEYLSIGMTNDYRIAIEEGSNMLRIGRRIFGERD